MFVHSVRRIHRSPRKLNPDSNSKNQLTFFKLLINVFVLPWSLFFILWNLIFRNQDICDSLLNQLFAMCEDFNLRKDKAIAEAVRDDRNETSLVLQGKKEDESYPYLFDTTVEDVFYPKLFDTADFENWYWEPVQEEIIETYYNKKGQEIISNIEDCLTIPGQNPNDLLHRYLDVPVTDTEEWYSLINKTSNLVVAKIDFNVKYYSVIEKFLVKYLENQNLSSMGELQNLDLLEVMVKLADSVSLENEKEWVYSISIYNYRMDTLGSKFNRDELKDLFEAVHVHPKRDCGICNGGWWGKESICRMRGLFDRYKQYWRTPTLRVLNPWKLRIGFYVNYVKEDNLQELQRAPKFREVEV